MTDVTRVTTKSTIDTKTAKELITDHLAAYASDPDAFPRALAARAAMPNRYSIANQILIMSQGDIDVLADRIMPASEWRVLGYSPRCAATYIWSKPIIGTMHEDGSVSYGKPDTDEDGEGRTFRRFKLVPTYPAAHVVDKDGATAETKPEPLAGEAAGVYDLIAGWLHDKGWTIQHKNVDSAGGWTSHADRVIRIDPRFTGWDRVRVLVHEATHALMHGPNDPRPYEGDHRGDQEAEADGVAYAVLMAFGQSETAGRSVRYVADWTAKDTERVKSALDRASSALDSIMGVIRGEDVDLREPNASKGDNRALAAWLRENDLPARGPVWTAVKSGERDLAKLAALQDAAAA